MDGLYYSILVDCSSPFEYVELGRVDDFSFLVCSSPFRSLLIYFNFTFSICHKILPYYFYYYCFWLGCDRPSGLFSSSRFASFYTHAILLTFFVCFLILFYSYCSHARVFARTFVHEFPNSNSHTHWYRHFSRTTRLKLSKSRLSKTNYNNSNDNNSNNNNNWVWAPSCVCYINYKIMSGMFSHINYYRNKLLQLVFCFSGSTVCLAKLQYNNMPCHSLSIKERQ